MAQFIITFCIYNHAGRLPNLVDALRTQACPVAFEMLAVNNSKDDTLTILKNSVCRPRARLTVFGSDTVGSLVRKLLSGNNDTPWRVLSHYALNRS